MPIHRNPLIYVSYAMLIGAFLSLAFIVYLLRFDGEPPFVFTGDPGPTNQPVYIPGETVKVQRSVCQDNDYDGVLHTIVVGEHNILPLPDMARPHRRGCVTVEFPAFVVPRDMPPDTYYIDARIDVRVNPIAVRTVAWQSQPFKVIECCMELQR